METALAEYLAEAPVFLRKFDGTILHWPGGLERLYGWRSDEAIGKNCHDLLASDFPEPVSEINARLLRDGAWSGLLKRKNKDGLTVWTESRWTLKSDGGGFDREVVIETNMDVTAREALTRELQHRIKNIVAVVQAIAHMSFRSGANKDELRGFYGRLEALALSQDMLISHHWERGEIGEIVKRAAESFGVANRFRASGKPVFLKPESVFAYTLALHELTTNAIKHGALSAAGGTVEVSWSLLHGDAAGRIHLVWRERGGPPVRPPDRRGFGTQLLEKILKAELGGTPLYMHFHPDGLVCEINGPTQKAPLGVPV